MTNTGPVYDIKLQGISYSKSECKRLERSLNVSLHYTRPEDIVTKNIVIFHSFSSSNLHKTHD